MSNSQSPCPSSGTGNHGYRKEKSSEPGRPWYKCAYCKDTRWIKPVNLAPHVHSYQVFEGKDMIFCTTCGNTKSV